MQANAKDPVQVIEELSKELGQAYLSVTSKLATAYLEAAKNGNSNQCDLIARFQQKLSVPMASFTDCSNSMGWCTPPGSSVTQMSQCDCLHGHPGCTDWMPLLRVPPGPGWNSAAVIFGHLCEILAQAYVAHGRPAGVTEQELEKAANERVITVLGHLISEANKSTTPGLGTCIVPFTSPPTPIRMTEAQCQQIPGGTWQPDHCASGY